MIAMATNNHSTFDALRSPLHSDSILTRSDRAASPTQFGAQIIDTIRLLVVQALNIIEDTLAFSKACRRYQYGYTIDGAITVHLNAAQATPSVQSDMIAIDS